MLKFDEISHTYTTETGAVVPSVTQIMQPLSQSHYGGISAATLKNAAERGTLVHNAIENWLKYQYDDCPEELRGYFEAFKAWYGKNNPEYIASEYRVYNDLLHYAGTIDLICKCGDATTIVDFKTTSELNMKLYSVQLEAYAHAYPAEKLKRMVLHLKADGTYKEERWDNNAKAFKIFSSCLAIHGYMSEK